MQEPEHFLVTFENMLEKVLTDALQSGQVPEERLDKIIENIAHTAVPKIAAGVLRSLKRRAPGMLREHRGITSGFEKRNFKRWKKAFDLLEMMIVIAQEAGEECVSLDRPRANSTNDYTFLALDQIFPRALLVVREIICLLKGGFPDGALTRWRTLHELVVVATFLSKQDASIAYRYLASFDFQAYYAAVQYNLYAERAGLEPFTDQDLAHMRKKRMDISSELGGDLAGDFGWAKPALKNSKATLASVEKESGLDHWRPRYRWASQHTHAGYRPSSKLLGLCETESPMMLVGPSNSGFVDPLQMTALSLTQVSAAFFLHNSNIDRAIIVMILSKLAKEIGGVAVSLERVSIEKHRSKGVREKKK